jgi:hypothetical protein
MCLDARDAEGEAALSVRKRPESLIARSVYSPADSPRSKVAASNDGTSIQALVERLGGRHVSDGSSRSGPPDALHSTVRRALTSNGFTVIFLNTMVLTALQRTASRLRH